MDLNFFYLNGGIGSRLQPFTLKSPFSFFSKGMIRIMGTPIAESQLYFHALKEHI